MKHKYLLLIPCLFFIRSVNAQPAPTIQDCLGAIPICQNVYTTSIAYNGHGNYDDIPWAGCLAYGGETNSVWYKFTAETSGNFRFVLTPNTIADYDFAVFNLTTVGCADLYNNFNSLVVSCNSSGYQGVTGISSDSGGTTNYTSWNYGNRFNADLSVQAGETYVLMISNWSNAQGGYTLDFSSSTAQLFNNGSPHILNMTSNPACKSSSLTFRFSENILCNSVADCDFTLTGPGGPYTITSITGAGCAAGGNNEGTFTINFTPPLSGGSTFNLNLVSSGCNSVTSACGNVASSTSFPFSMASSQTIPVSQVGDSLFVFPGYVSYQWYYQGNPINNAINYYYITNQAGSYSVSIIDSAGCLITGQASVITFLDNATMKGSNGINVYPNPVSQNVIISLPNPKGLVTVTDVTGRDVFSRQVTNENKLFIDASTFAKGIYVIQFSANNGNSYFVKMVKD